MLNSDLIASDDIFNVTSTDLYNSSSFSSLDALHPCDHRNNVSFNCSIDNYLVFVRGPQTLPLPIVLSVTILYVGTFIAGIVGNVIVCVVIIRHSSMHTATNYYLFSLAVSDLIYLMFGLPYDLSLFWHQYPYQLGLGFCKLRALISEASTYVSVLTIVAFSMERFLAICHPLHLYAMSGFKRAVRIIAGLWVISILAAVPFGVYSKIDYIFYPPSNTKILDSAFCAMLDNPPGFPLWEFSSIIFFAIPMAVMVILYGRMGLQIRFRSKHTSVLGVQQGSMHGESKQSQSRKAIIRMLAAVVITFFVSWAPFHAQRLMFLYARDWKHYDIVNTWLFSVAGLLYYFSCTINPILYNVMSHRYRVAFRETLCGKEKAYYNNNGFSREAQSSVREPMMSSTGSGYDSSHLVRIRSSRLARLKERDSNSAWVKQSLLNEQLIEEVDISMVKEHPATTDVVVVIGNNVNGRPKSSTITSSTTPVSLFNNHIISTTNNNGTPTADSLNCSSAQDKDETCI